VFLLAQNFPEVDGAAMLAESLGRTSGVLLLAERLVEDHLAAGVPEPGGGLRRPQHLSAVRVQEHLRRGHPAFGDERGDLRRALLRLLDAHPHPSRQVRLRCPAS
jgi:hypothetical protein